MTIHESRVAKTMLRMAGVASEEAARIAAFPLPGLDIEAGFPCGS